MTEQNILKIVSEVVEIPIKKIVSKSSVDELVQARHLVIYLCKYYLNTKWYVLVKLINRSRTQVFTSPKYFKTDLAQNYVGANDLLNKCILKIENLSKGFDFIICKYSTQYYIK